MIDNPLPEQTMEQKNKEFEDELFKNHCYEQAKEICEQNNVFSELIEHFQQWYHDYYYNKPEEMPNVVSAEDVDLINTWWDMGDDAFDNYVSPYEDFDPTPDADCPYSDAEYIVTAKERSQIAFEQKLRDKG